jgi:hypothetical protein
MASVAPAGPAIINMDANEKPIKIVQLLCNRPMRGDLPICAILYVKKSPAERRAGQREDCGIAFSGQLWGCVVSAGDHNFCR